MTITECIAFWGGFVLSVSQFQSLAAQVPQGRDSTDCSIALSGRIIDEHDVEPLTSATLYLLNAGLGAYSDSDGSYAFEGLCGGSDTLRVTHIGCEPVWIPIYLSSQGPQGNKIDVALEHHAELLDAIEVHAHRNSAAASDLGAGLNAEQLDASAGDKFSEVVARLPGVQTVSTGANVGRPIVDGLGGARLTLVQNGVALASQDWGDEHAPEIDPFAATGIQLARSGGTMQTKSTTGATLVLDDAGMPDAAAPEGQVLLAASSVDLGGVAGVHVGQRLGPRWGYRAQLSGANSADARTRDYVLSNTGTRRAGGQVRLFYADSVREISAGYRAFANEAGILRAAHIGNLTDLERALASNVPLIIEPRTRDIDAPRQRSQHHWWTLNGTQQLRGGNRLNFAYSAQLNHREEYDIRRGGRSAKPSLDLRLLTQDLRAEYDLTLPQEAELTAGVHFTLAANRNDENTGVRAFIPFYDASGVAAYSTWRRIFSNTTLEASARVDRQTTTAAYSRRDEAGQPSIERIERSNWLVAAAAGATRYLENGGTLRLRATLGSRAPNPAERFADGVHHALAVIERGDIDLTTERSAKLTAGYGIERNSRTSVHLSGFVQGFSGFIYQQYQAEPELTIRGAFPVVNYEQADALLAGTDLDAHAPLGPLQLGVQVSYLYGQLPGGASLPDISPVRGTLDVSYGASLSGALKDYRLGANLLAVAQQGRAPSTLPRSAPGAYALLGLEASGHLAIAEHVLGIHFSILNLANTVYRDYLDRLRYYADRPGRKIQLRLLYDF